MKLVAAVLAVCALSVATAHAASSIPLEKVKEKAATCAACHGPEGNADTPAQSQYPRLAGQYHDYLARALHEYKSGERKNPIMVGMAAPLSDAEIDALAHYFSAMPGKITDLHGHAQGD